MQVRLSLNPQAHSPRAGPGVADILELEVCGAVRAEYLDEVGLGF